MKRILVFTMPGNPWVTRGWLRGLVRYARTGDWRLEVFEKTDERQEKGRLAKLIRRYHPDGIVAAYTEGLQRYIPVGLPIVWMDAHKDKDKFVGHDCRVSHDEGGAAKAVADEFLRLGLTHFAVAGYDGDVSWSRERVKAFRAAVRSVTRSVEILENSGLLDPMESYRLLKSWLKALPKPCGLFAVNDLIAVNILSVAYDLGIEVPRDLAVIGVDNDEDLCQMSLPTLSSVATDWERGGYLLGELLDARMCDPQVKPIRKTFGELGIVRRASSTCGVKRVDARVAEASAFIREHACEGIGVNDVAQHMGCSRSLAMMRYLEVTGRSIFAEIREAQLAQVLVLLSRRQMQIGAIANRCGWRSATALQSYFTKRMGMTMREWRLRNVAS